MSSESLPTVFIYEEEANLIGKWTSQYPAIETGGDLFGLWKSDGEVVVQVVIGPGKESQRTPTSFFQDEGYLSNVGGFLTTREGLCNIGAWHSHHTMNLPGPSSGDAATIWRHLPTPGRFLLVIASIKTRDDAGKVDMTCSLFESSNGEKRMLRMNCTILKGNSPFRGNLVIQGILRSGAEDGRRKEASRSRNGDRRERETCEGGGSRYRQQLSHYAWFKIFNHQKGSYDFIRIKSSTHHPHSPNFKEPQTCHHENIFVRQDVRRYSGHCERAICVQDEQDCCIIL